MAETTELKQKARVTKEIPQRLSESVQKFKESFEEVLSATQVKFMHHINFF